jgi:uncharacterized protein (UPF0332 family)
MNYDHSELIKYRLERSISTYKDAQMLSQAGSWHSTINRLYYSAYYAVLALLLSANLKPTTHTGVKTLFSDNFIKTNKLSPETGKLYSQLFNWRQKGDYDDFFEFNAEIVLPYFESVKQLIYDISIELKIEIRDNDFKIN